MRRPALLAALLLVAPLACGPARAEPTVTTLRPGDGRTFPQRGQRVVVHYTGTLTNGGATFDSSRTRGQPFTFTIGTGQVIRCWDVGVMRMSVGERAKLHCPAADAYGTRGAGGVIPPNAELDFDVELLRVE